MKNDKKTLSFWLVFVCFMLGIIESFLVYIGASFVINFLVEGVAIALSVLVYFGVLKTGDNKNLGETYQEIKDELNQKDTDDINKK